MKSQRKRIYEIIEIGNVNDFISKAFDYFIVVVILLNILVTMLETFRSLEGYHNAFLLVESITCIIFAVEYILRLWTAEFAYPNMSRAKATIRFIFSFYGLVDLLAFLPFFIPGMFSSGIVAFRILRVIRIFHLFRINTKYDAFNVITNVLNEKKQPLFFSISLILIMMLASSLCMYNLEHAAQPDVFKNAFSGIWWSVSTLLTVGYGDIYPITMAGKFMATIITFLGVGLVAIPTGIISAGFVEHYTKIKSVCQISYNTDNKFTMIQIEADHPWAEKALGGIDLPPEFEIVAILRDEGEIHTPHEKVIVKTGDRLIIKNIEK